ncbi:hypothetical protein BKA62DRAFT_718145 [Auriculariales sp. MPI-PUGE-AT-0066]|nr:hypothetical protein BKA62DRAFT_718145 [Auriculariales sp. MPI-PUGE-AT-0066]
MRYTPPDLPIDIIFQIFGRLARKNVILASTTCRGWRRAAHLDDRFYLHAELLLSETGNDLLKLSSALRRIGEVLQHACDHDWNLSLTFDASRMNPRLPSVSVQHVPAHIAWTQFCDLLYETDGDERTLGLSLWTRIVRLKLVLLDVSTKGGGGGGALAMLKDPLTSLRTLHMERIDVSEDKAIASDVPAIFIISHSPLRSITLRNFWFVTMAANFSCFNCVSHADISFSASYAMPKGLVQLSNHFPSLADLTVSPIVIEGTDTDNALIIDWDDVKNNLSLNMIHVAVSDDDELLQNIPPQDVRRSVSHLHLHVDGHDYSSTNVDRIRQALLFDVVLPEVSFIGRTENSLPEPSPICDDLGRIMRRREGVLAVTRTNTRSRTWSAVQESSQYGGGSWNTPAILISCSSSASESVGMRLTRMALDIPFVRDLPRFGTPHPHLRELTILVAHDVKVHSGWNCTATEIRCDDAECTAHGPQRANPSCCPALSKISLQSLGPRRIFDAHPFVQLVHDLGCFATLPVSSRTPVELELRGVELDFTITEDNYFEPGDVLSCFVRVSEKEWYVHAEEDLEQFCDWPGRWW